MNNYRVTVNEHNIYDVWVEADSKEEADELVSNTVIEEDRKLWVLDVEASWMETGTIYNEDGDEL